MSAARYHYKMVVGRWLHKSIALPKAISCDRAARQWLRDNLSDPLPYGKLVKIERTVVYEHRPREAAKEF